MILSTIPRQESLSGEFWQSARYQTIRPASANGLSRNEAYVSKRDSPRGIPLSRADQVTIVAVAAGILIVTGFLVGLLF